jgi:sensor histidine kinase YesM
MKSIFEYKLFSIIGIFLFLAIANDIWIYSKIKFNTTFLDSISKPKFIIKDYQFIEGDSPYNDDTESFHFIEKSEDVEWLKGSPTFIPESESGYAWLRTRLSQEELTNDSVFFFEHFYIAIEIFQDREKIYSYGDMNNLESIRFDGTNIEILPLKPVPTKYLYARIRFKDKYNLGFGGRFISIGSKFSLLQLILQQEIIPLSFSLLTFLIGFYSLLLYFFRWNEKYKLLLDYSFFMISMSAAMFSTCMLPQIFLQMPTFSFFLEIIPFPLSAIFMLRIYSYVTNFEYWNYLKYLYFALILSGLFLICTYIYIIYTNKTLPFFIIPSAYLLFFYVIENLILGTLSVLKWKSKDYVSVFLGFAFFLNIGLLLLDILRGIFLDDNIVWYNHWSIFFSILAQSLILDKEFKKNNQELVLYEQNLNSIRLELEKLQLSSLKEKMNPDFLFSSLRFIKKLIFSNDEKVGKAILSLSESYRYILDKSSLSYVQFEDEIKFTKNFLYLTELKQNGKLSISIDMPKTSIKLYIKPLSIQPILEMIIENYMQRIETSSLEIRIKIKVISEGIKLRIENKIYKLERKQEVEFKEIFENSLDSIVNSIYKIDKNFKVKLNEDAKINLATFQFTIPKIQN